MVADMGGDSSAFWKMNAYLLVLFVASFVFFGTSGPEYLLSVLCFDFCCSIFLISCLCIGRTDGLAKQFTVLCCVASLIGAVCCVLYYFVIWDIVVYAYEFFIGVMFLFYISAVIYTIRWRH
jgi:hypothetical protein